MSITLVSSKQIMVDGKPAGPLSAALAKHQERRDEIIVAFEQFHATAGDSIREEAVATERAKVKAESTVAQLALDQAKQERDNAIAALTANAVKLTAAEEALADSRANVTNLSAAVEAAQQARLAAEAAANALRSKYEPAPYLLVIDLPESQGEADCAGLRRVELGGNWSGDLVKRTGESAFLVVKAGGFSTPVDPAAKSLDEAKAALLAAYPPKAA
jgi:multidrug efflux pump subunit AcrA (membrane-fusion protein)